MVKRIVKITGAVIAVLLAAAVIYVLYVVLSYKRIPDMQVLAPEGTAAEEYLQTGTVYTAVAQNCGFGAYSPEFTFFMDGGTQSWAKSRESAIANIDLAAEKVLSFEPDFALFQEVDTDSTRTYHINQKEQIAEKFPGYAKVFAVNYHSAFLMYPLTQPHGASNSGILTCSRFPVASALRRSLTISTGFNKYLDLDRCYSVSRIPAENGKELVLYNVHTSAYGGSDEIRTSQLTQLTQDMRAEYEKGNYCVCGGDFNHDFIGNSTTLFNGADAGDFGWAQPFPTELLPEGIIQCTDYDDEQLTPSCRNCDVPYGPGCMTFIVDGYLVSDNVEVVELHNIDTGFIYSDHNPVVLKFRLKDSQA